MDFIVDGTVAYTATEGVAQLPARVMASTWVFNSGECGESWAGSLDNEGIPGEATFDWVHVVQ
ncbi:MAG: hypothetical protein ISR64_05200 [Deltaproteobacteria bacterium]|nr:hypothetical protein [Deltaproteobacteria bacterium]